MFAAQLFLKKKNVISVLTLKKFINTNILLYYKYLNLCIFLDWLENLNI